MILTVTTIGEVKESLFPDSFLNFSYREIGCSLVDRIRLTKEVDMWVDDEGMYTQSVNPLATHICRKFGYPAEAIYGNVVITGTKWTDEGPDAGPLSEKAVNYLKRVAYDFRMQGALM